MLVVHLAVLLMLLVASHRRTQSLLVCCDPGHQKCCHACLVNAPGAQEGAGHVRGLCFSQGADGSIVEGQQFIMALHVISERSQQGPSTDNPLSMRYLEGTLLYQSPYISRC